MCLMTPTHTSQACCSNPSLAAAAAHSLNPSSRMHQSELRTTAEQIRTAQEHSTARITHSTRVRTRTLCRLLQHTPAWLLQLLIRCIKPRCRVCAAQLPDSREPCRPLTRCIVLHTSSSSSGRGTGASYSRHCVLPNWPAPGNPAGHLQAA
jgi:hypothetical protein